MRTTILAMRKYERKIPTTGYWLFICNTDKWSADEFLREYGKTLYYRASVHHRDEFQAGQYGVLRLNKDRRSKIKRGGRPPLHAGIYAIVEVLGKAEFRIDTDSKFYADVADAEEAVWRVPIRVVSNLLDEPVLASRLPAVPVYQYIHSPLQTSSIPLEGEAFFHILMLADKRDAAQEAIDCIKTGSGLASVENYLQDETPQIRERISRQIERGQIGSMIKEKRSGRCQICEALGRDPVSFIDSNGRNFAEAHHVIPVHRLERGSLAACNIMVLCPNHHRQAHFGRFLIEQDMADHWLVNLDGKKLKIDKTVF